MPGLPFMLITPELSTQFVNKCMALAYRSYSPSNVQEMPRAGQRAWLASKQRWVNVHSQLAVFSYVSWVDTVVFSPSQADVWPSESLGDITYVTQSVNMTAIVYTADLFAAGGQCAVQEWPHAALQEDFELKAAYQTAANKTSWMESYEVAFAKGRIKPVRKTD